MTQQVNLLPDPGPSQATPGLFNRTFSALSQNFDQVQSELSGVVLSVTSTPHQIAISSSTGNPTFSLPSALTIPGSVEVVSDASFDSTVSVGGAALFQSTISGVGRATFSAVSVGSGFSALANAFVGSNLTVVGNINSNSSLSVDGNAKIGSSVTAGRESYASAFYVTAPPKGALPSVVDIGYADVGMGFHRSTNSNTLRFSNGTFNEQGSGCNVSILTSRSEIMATKGFWSGFGGNVGRYQFGFSTSGMNQNTSGFVFNKNASPATTLFGVDGSGQTFFIGTTPSGGTYPIQFSGDLSLTGTVHLNSNPLLGLRQLTSFNSTSMNTGEFVLAVVQASGISLGYRSGGTIWYFESSSSTKG